MIDQNYIAEHINEFASFITTTTIDRIIKEMDLENTIYSVKYMVLISMGGHIDGLNILIYRHFILVGVITIKNKTIVHQNVNKDGINIKEYLPKNVDYGKANDNRPSSQKKDSLFTALDIPYNNDLTTTEKLNILQEYTDNLVKPKLKPIKQKKKIIKKPNGKSFNYDEKINNPLFDKGYDWIKNNK